MLAGSFERVGCGERPGRSEAIARSQYSWGCCLFVSRSSLLYFSLIMLCVVTMVRDTGDGQPALPWDYVVDECPATCMPGGRCGGLAWALSDPARTVTLAPEASNAATARGV